MSKITKALEKSRQQREPLGDRAGDVTASRAKRLDGRQPKRVSPPHEDTLARYQLNTVTLDTAKLNRRRVITESSGAGARTSYNVLRTRVLQRMHSNNWNTLAISSAGASEGKTLTAINLGISMARQGHQRVVLIDFDLQRPSIAKNLSIDSYEHDLSSYVSGEVGPESILYATPIENLWVIPNAQSTQNSSEVLASDRIDDLIKWIRSIDSESIVILDLPPLLVSDDVLAVSPLFDALLLVIAEGRTTRENARNTRELVEDHKIELLGTVLNKSSDRMATYSY